MCLFTTKLVRHKKDQEWDVARLWKTSKETGGPEAAMWGRPAPPWCRLAVRVLAPLLEASSTASEESS